MKTCETCREKKKLDEFGNNQRRSDGKQKYCKECSKKKDKKHYLTSIKRRDSIRKNSSERIERARQVVKQYLSTHHCVDCPESDIRVLQFDHITSKMYSISTLISWGASPETILEEIGKCQVRCANCHFKKTANQFNWWRNK